MSFAQGASAAADALLADAAAKVRERVVIDGRPSARLLDREQRATHGLAWFATYVEAIRQLAAYATGLRYDELTPQARRSLCNFVGDIARTPRSTLTRAIGHAHGEHLYELAWARDPRLVWQFYSMRRKAAHDKKPNPGHYALARLEEALGERMMLCTQNVDELHELAGSRRVVHMHGRLFQSRCDRCARPPFEDRNTYEDEVPRCDCGGRIRPHICWFGEMPYELELIDEELEQRKK